jgi:hypothetical protein
VTAEWPEFRIRAARILGKVLDAAEADRLAGLLAAAAASMLGADLGVQPDPLDMTDEERAIVARQFARDEGCNHCGGMHLRACPRVKRLVFSGDKIAEVEFWRYGEWPTGDVLWPEDFPGGEV